MQCIIATGTRRSAGGPEREELRAIRRNGKEAPTRHSTRLTLEPINPSIHPLLIFERSAPKLRLAVIGLGRMGANISRRLMRGGHSIVAFDRDGDSVRKLVEEGVLGAGSLSEVVAMLEAPRIFWVMLPAGGPTEETVAELRSIAQAGDVIIDGGNSFFKDDIRRHRECLASGVHYVDVGTSGGVWGLERGYCLMIG